METDEDKKRKWESINAGHQYIVNIKSLISKSPLQKYTFVLEFQTQKLDLATTRVLPSKTLLLEAQPWENSLNTKKHTPTGVKHLEFPQRRPHRLWRRSIQQCSEEKLDWVRQRNATQQWVYKMIPSHLAFFCFLLFVCLFFLTKCYRTMQQSSPCPSMAAPP